MYKGFEELREMGFLTTNTMPRMIACQTTGCMPIYTAFHAGKRFADRHENAATIASGLRVPMALGDFMVIDTVRKSGGTILAAEEQFLTEYQRQVASAEGLIICPESAACIGGLQQLVERKLIQPHERAVIFNTAAGQKYCGREKLPLIPIDISKPIDWDAFERQYLI
jgi:threonine synthase